MFIVPSLLYLLYILFQVWSYIRLGPFPIFFSSCPLFGFLPAGPHCYVLFNVYMGKTMKASLQIELSNWFTRTKLKATRRRVHELVSSEGTRFFCIEKLKKNTRPSVKVVVVLSTSLQFLSVLMRWLRATRLRLLLCYSFEQAIICNRSFYLTSDWKMETDYCQLFF